VFLYGPVAERGGRGGREGKEEKGGFVLLDVYGKKRRRQGKVIYSSRYKRNSGGVSVWQGTLVDYFRGGERKREGKRRRGNQPSFAKAK